MLQHRQKIPCLEKELNGGLPARALLEIIEDRCEVSDGEPELGVELPGRLPHRFPVLRHQDFVLVSLLHELKARTRRVKARPDVHEIVAQLMDHGLDLGVAPLEITDHLVDQA